MQAALHEPRILVLVHTPFVHGACSDRCSRRCASKFEPCKTRFWLYATASFAADFYDAHGEWEASQHLAVVGQVYRVTQCEKRMFQPGADPKLTPAGVKGAAATIFLAASIAVSRG